MSRGIANRAGSYRNHGEFSEHEKTHDELLRERQSRDPFYGKTQIPRKAGESKNSWRRRVGLPVKTKMAPTTKRASSKKKTFKPQPSVMVEIMTPCGCLVSANRNSIQQRLNSLFDNGHKGKESRPHTIGKFDSDGDWSPYTKEDCEIHPMPTWVNPKRCDPSHPRAYTPCPECKTFDADCENCAEPLALEETSRSYDSYMAELKSDLQKMVTEREVYENRDGSFRPPFSWSKAKLVDLLIADDLKEEEE